MSSTSGKIACLPIITSSKTEASGLFVLIITEAVFKPRYIKHNEIYQRMTYALNTEYIESLLKFLNNEGLIQHNVNQTYTITAKGFVKLFTNCPVLGLPIPANEPTPSGVAIDKAA